MICTPRRFKNIALTTMCLLVASAQVAAQHWLNKTVSVEADKRTLQNVLNDISTQGGFYFSYNSDLIHGDRLVSISAKKKTVRDVLDILFEGSCQYKEDGNHIVLQQSGKEKNYTITGYVVDRATGARISNTSVYEKQQLASSLTNEQGYFKLKLKNKSATGTTVSISKEWYKDTSITITPGYDQELEIAMIPIRNVPLPEVTVSACDHNPVEKTWLGKLFLSSRQRVQSVNLRKYFVDKPYQFSAIPGAGTHGKMTAQVVNKFSFNLLGGYTAGVNGFEIAGVFNIDKKDVQYAQIAGLFNVVGGKVNGMQIGGAANIVMDSVKGGTVAGVVNIDKGNVEGTQVSGVYGHISGSMHGAQVAGIVGVTGKGGEGVQVAGVGNFVKEEMSGTQVAGIINISAKEIKGVQISGIFNYAKKIDGVQVGLVNIADSSTGYSIGLLNLVKNGYHKLSVSGNEVIDLNVSLKTGNRRFYTILTTGMNLSGNKKAYAFGYGFGNEANINKRLTINTEIISQYIYLGSWDQHSSLWRLQTALNFHVTDWLSVFAGPAYSLYYRDKMINSPGYMSDIPGSLPNAHKVDNDVYGWLGWHFGINLF